MPHRAKVRDTSRRMYVYKLDEEGNWFWGKNPMDDPELVELFSRDIRFDADSGHYIVICDGEVCRIRVKDAPSFVDEVELVENPDGSLREIWVTLLWGHREKLNPATLSAARNGALYCIDSRGLRTKFRKKPHLKLGKRVREEGGRFVLRVDQKDYEVRLEE